MIKCSAKFIHHVYLSRLPLIFSTMPRFAQYPLPRIFQAANQAPSLLTAPRYFVWVTDINKIR